MTTKNSTKNSTVTDTIIESPVTAPVTAPVTDQKAEAEKLLAEAKALAAKAKEAAKAAKEASAKLKAVTGRPIRTSYFIAYLENDFTTYIGKGDVHYCVEKSAIDFIASQREQGIEDQTVIIYKVNKASKKEPSDHIAISKVYLDKATKQIVID